MSAIESGTPRPRVIVARTAPMSVLVSVVQAVRDRLPDAAVLVVTQAGTESEAQDALRPDAIVTVPAGFLRLRSLRWHVVRALRAWHADEAIVVEGEASGGSLYRWVWALWLSGARRIGVSRWEHQRVERITPWLASLTMANPIVRWPLALLAALCLVALAVVRGATHRCRPRRTRSNNTGPATVLFVAHESFLNGSGNSLVQMLRVIDRRRFTPIVAVPTDGALVNACDALGIEVVYIRSSWLLRQRPCAADLFDDLATLTCSYGAFVSVIEQRSIDVVHTNSLICPDAMLAAWALGVPRVWHFREYLFPNPVWRAVQRGVLRLLADRIIVISEACRRTVGHASRRGRIERVWNGIDVGAFSPTTTRDEARRRESVDGEAFVVGVFGALLPQKGQHVLLAALPDLVARVPACRALIVGELGDGPYGDHLQTLVREHGLDGIVRFVGHRPDVRSLMTASDVVVVPSTWEEPFGRVAIEAMALERAVVATGTGGLREIVVDGETGLTVPPEEPQALSDALVTLARDEPRRAAMGRAGRARVACHFDIHMTVAAVQATWSELCGLPKHAEAAGDAAVASTSRVETLDCHL
jgi:glycosyltransferase involved in cell wall biosynthesis